MQFLLGMAFFSSHKKEEKLPVQESILSIIAAGVQIQGDLLIEGDIRIEGSIKGNVYCKSRLVIGPQGKIIGKVDSQNATISGTIEGTLVIRDTLQLTETAKINGDIITHQMSIQAGAIFSGNCKMGHEALEIIQKNYPEDQIPKELL